MKAKSKNLPFIDSVFLWINYALCASLLLGYLAPYVDPRTFWPIAFFGLAYPPLLLANVIIIVYWLFRRSWFIGLSLITILIGWNVLNNNIGIRLPAGASQSAPKKQLRLMTYNVHDFKRYGAKNESSTRHEILDLIGQEQPDVIGIQEFFTRKKGQYAMIDSVKKVMRAGNYYFEPTMISAGESVGMAIFSKYPIKSYGLVQLAAKGSGNQCVYVDVEKDSSMVRIYSVHLQSIAFEPQDYKYLGNLSSKGKADIGATKRVGWKLKTAFQKRAEQVFVIKDHAKKCPYPYVISGDFNDTPSSFAVNQMAKGLKNAFRERGAGLGRTYNGAFPNYQIDYVMASPQFDVMEYKIIEKKLSDHYPLSTLLVLK
ncbi:MULTISPECIES: endonuclease/exonuclease/phosphatase family protein [unclassified Mucilaginibacter]|uniref:endonuclease/exonuclease/phosphatase family protein n=1 Tax=unclassified Mucilaginibacter TaxID=2617802 RepID=UPI002AC8F1D4|nr:MULTISPECIES: endonuclease/exonuclease/phosphatase family protein [unclassified Mucilaginibacter]MEB0261637.1 endonuclease/exonuclease/phosphatase family protein [Mucilaginibacter sp. 10I4]MEB0278502.1 endonuclease/exonuclease/phosphatase family protein [Mucilaginibacter sp. 10B2]MEB0300722.1 endonuclease/exonuclease/phosphatase family protein [Mucilaginibacter sp. 5C4]WPX23542.1 endonuclease/exonuclease/phosphatase family protein [Mucilaginibacter sp. 5C4]